MTKRAVRILAKDIIEGKLGLKVANTDLVLLEASKNENGQVDYIAFYRKGFLDIHYDVTMKNHQWELTIYNCKEQTSIRIK